MKSLLITLNFFYIVLGTTNASTSTISQSKIQPISLEIKRLLGDQSYLDKILLEGVEKANLIASKKIKKIKELVGF